ncbi:hypothetical protein [Litorimonas haliclonae]|uniref:hypothetical protein n=1 Tax=Litorimonas haliclonae TaxID=2081977 RepID=UPI0039EFABC6
MKRVVTQKGLDKFSLPEGIRDLITLYDDVTKRLKECADYKSVGDSAQDQAVETLEEELHQLQDNILKSSGKIILRSKQDLKALLDFWYMTTVESSGDEISASDRIIMNFRDYYDEITFDNLRA